MAATEFDLNSRTVLSGLTDMDPYVRLIAAATGPGEIVNAVNDYLAGWSEDQIRNLQKIDGGWGPFDERQRPARLCGVADVPRICDSVHRRCDVGKRTRHKAVTVRFVCCEIAAESYFVRSLSYSTCEPIQNQTRPSGFWTPRAR